LLISEVREIPQEFQHEVIVVVAIADFEDKIQSEVLLFDLALRRKDVIDKKNIGIVRSKVVLPSVGEVKVKILLLSHAQSHKGRLG
jgi:hypothetical protein